MPISRGDLEYYNKIINYLREKNSLDIPGTLPEYTERLLKFKGLKITHTDVCVRIEKNFLTTI